MRLVRTNDTAKLTNQPRTSEFFDEGKVHCASRWDFWMPVLDTAGKVKMNARPHTIRSKAAPIFPRHFRRYKVRCLLSTYRSIAIARILNLFPRRQKTLVNDIHWHNSVAYLDCKGCTTVTKTIGKHRHKRTKSRLTKPNIRVYGERRSRKYRLKAYTTSVFPALPMARINPREMNWKSTNAPEGGEVADVAFLGSARIFLDSSGWSAGCWSLILGPSATSLKIDMVP